MKNTRNARFQRGTGCFSCRVCGRKSRETGNNGCGDICSQCFDLAGIENTFSDYGDEEAYKDYGQEAREHLAALAEKGIDVNTVWADLIARLDACDAKAQGQAPMTAEEAYDYFQAAPPAETVPSLPKFDMEVHRAMLVENYRNEISRATRIVNETLAKLADHGRISTHDGFNLGSAASDLQALAAQIELLDTCIRSAK